MEVEQILMIHKDNNQVRIPLEVMMPFSKRTNYSEQFAIKNLIIMFSRVRGLGEVTARVILTVIISLQEYCSGSDKGGIRG
jgi:hypothetical protein